MDIPVHSLMSAQGIPIYFEEYPDHFRPMSIMIVMFSGGADDAALSAPGIHHWAEHIVFRGTVGYPNGAKEISGRISELGGHVGAFTAHSMTAYHATGPSKAWREIAEIVTDLVARPLLRPEDIDAERSIIEQEIRESNADVDRRSTDLLLKTLWPEHPIGSNVIGTAETLARTDLGAIELMRSKSYGRARAVAFVAGSIKPEDVQSGLSELFERIPNNPISERRMPASYGALPPWRPGAHRYESSEFDTTVVKLVFPKPPTAGNQLLVNSYHLLQDLFLAGDSISPLSRILREEQRLTYGAHMSMLNSADGGAVVFEASTDPGSVDAVVNAFYQTIEDPELRSLERWQYVMRVNEAQYDMRVPNPLRGPRGMLDDVCYLGHVLSIEESHKHLMETPRESVMQTLDSLTRDKARIVALIGT